MNTCMCINMQLPINERYVYIIKSVTKFLNLVILEDLNCFAIVYNKSLLLLYTILNSIVICKELWLKAKLAFLFI